LVDANNLTGYAQVMEELVTNHVGALVVDRVYTYGAIARGRHIQNAMIAFSNILKTILA
jgi:hypothetical protein